jgi:hypothetical protein
MDRDELLLREDEGWTALMTQVERVPADRRDAPGVVPGWSVNDLVWHCGKWADWVREPLEQMRRGSYDPDREYPWERMNDEWAAESKALSWEQIEAGANAMRLDARNAFLALPTPGEEAGREFASETVEHYAEHAAEIARFAEGAS